MLVSLLKLETVDNIGASIHPLRIITILPALSGLKPLCFDAEGKGDGAFPQHFDLPTHKQQPRTVSSGVLNLYVTADRQPPVVENHCVCVCLWCVSKLKRQRHSPDRTIGY